MLILDGSIAVAWEEQAEGRRLSIKASRGPDGVEIVPEEVGDRKKEIIVGDGGTETSKVLNVGSNGVLEGTIRF